MNDNTKEYTRAWLHKAGSDLKNAQLIMSSHDEAPPLDTVCFHCQQAAEKFLKAFLVYHDRLFPYSHNLADPVAACMELDRSFISIQRKAETLTPYAVEIRHADDFYLPTKQEAEEAYAIAEEIKKFIIARLDVDLSRGE
jgi:HEPN domain-containing protein